MIATIESSPEHGYKVVVLGAAEEYAKEIWIDRHLTFHFEVNSHRAESRIIWDVLSAYPETRGLKECLQIARLERAISEIASVGDFSMIGDLLALLSDARFVAERFREISFAQFSFDELQAVRDLLQSFQTIYRAIGK